MNKSVNTPKMLAVGDGVLVVGIYLSVVKINSSVCCRCWARMHHKVVGNFGSEADV